LKRILQYFDWLHFLRQFLTIEKLARHCYVYNSAAIVPLFMKMINIAKMKTNFWPGWIHILLDVTSVNKQTNKTEINLWMSRSLLCMRIIDFNCINEQKNQGWLIQWKSMTAFIKLMISNITVAITSYIIWIFLHDNDKWI